ncbi:hypothetical protein KIH39_00290 [Telmatocola sphagniphila]|uniref:Bestrophin homolog n=1 Tax=Telmatocola sphagniphila TaxID=1123043 RepID=A0A8E6B6W8_9BACT|nr:bestrophin family ion channel [Telmatocola sphagniphila]QVL32394.1 hypothetical protein KIH39_00290 [Telmatocola sphagniphila]
MPKRKPLLSWPGRELLRYGPADTEWRFKFVHWIAVFPYVARHSLRKQQPEAEVLKLVGPEQTKRLSEANHMPVYVALQLADLLREGCEKFQMDRFAFLQIDKERALLIDHIGACERIAKTPLPIVYSIKIRRFLLMFLLSLPFALLHRVEADAIVPFITMLVAYPLLSLDQIGVQLENPFSPENLSHLPLREICMTIEGNVLSLLKAVPTNSLVPSLPENEEFPAGRAGLSPKSSEK